MKNNDKRLTRRVPVRIKVDYRDVDDFLSSFVTNLSEGGVFISTNNIQPVGTKVKLKFLLPKTRKTIRSTGIVMWVNTNDPRGEEFNGMGVKFHNLEEKDQKLITEVIKKISTHES